MKEIIAAIEKILFLKSVVGLGTTTGEFTVQAKPNIDDLAFSYGGKRNTTSYTSKTGVWNESATGASFGTDLRFGLTGGDMWPTTGAGVGPNASTPHTIKYTFPPGYVGGSCYINYMQHSNGGYIDVYAMRTQDTDEIFVGRINTHQKSQMLLGRATTVASEWTAL